MSNKISAAANPALANELIQKMQEGPKETSAPKIVSPSDTTVVLPAGYLTPDGEVLRTAEVRELNGLDEEAIAKSNNLGKAIMSIIQRATVSIGGQKVTEDMLDFLIAGDRDAILLGIFKTTFGNTADIQTYCSGCGDFKTVTVDIDEDIKVKPLLDPVNGRVFSVDCKVGPVTVRLPNGKVQRLLIENADKTAAELKTILLENCVTDINGSPVYSKVQVQRLSLVDRNKINEELNDRAPGPQFEDITLPCPDCGGEVVVPINLGTLFRF